MGDVIGDLSSRRGAIQGTDIDPESRSVRVTALVPQAELHLYATDLFSKTHGRGTFTTRFHGYEEVPAEAAQKVIEESGKESREMAEV